MFLQYFFWKFQKSERCCFWYCMFYVIKQHIVLAKQIWGPCDGLEKLRCIGFPVGGENISVTRGVVSRREAPRNWFGRCLVIGETGILVVKKALIFDDNNCWLLCIICIVFVVIWYDIVRMCCISVIIGVNVGLRRESRSGWGLSKNDHEEEGRNDDEENDDKEKGWGWGSAWVWSWWLIGMTINWGDEYWILIL